MDYPEHPTAPEYTRLKDLHLQTALVRNGSSSITIATPASGVHDAPAAAIQRIVEKRTGVRIPIVTEDSPTAAVPFTGNLILLGNRSTSRTISLLYDRYYTLLDLRYPGPGGHVVRSLHNPFGNGCNAILVGGSDPAGVEAAAGVLVEKLSQADIEDSILALGWLVEIRLGDGTGLPEKLEEFEIWEASAGYGSVGYFGWNSISKRMAMYYMTGDPFHARQVVRLAFPDEQAKAEISAIDGERIENKDEPLSGPYHYNAHMMILYWDLIEESPVFSDEERLRITNAFSRQLLHAEDQGWRRQIYQNARLGKDDAYAEPPPHVGSRHGQWSAISLYCLGRYFDTYYPEPLWKHCVQAGKWHFASLHCHAWVGGENDNLFWYNTGIAPILSYLLLTGDRAPIDNGVLAGLLRGLDILISGRQPDWALNSASIGFLHKAAHLTGDGHFLEYLRRTGIDLDLFRLGQSFWPGPELQPALPGDLVGRWSIHPIPEPMWRGRDSDLPLEDSFLFGSFRSAADDRGDFILLKGMNGASRNPYHTFALLELRLGGQTVLEGYLNQLLTRSGGLVEPRVAMDAVLLRGDVVGRTAVAVGAVPRAAFASWQRTLVQRVGRYALVVDSLDFRGDSHDMEVEILWQGKGKKWSVAADGVVRLESGEASFAIHLADPVDTAVARHSARLVWRGPVRDGERRLFFSLLAVDRNSGSPACLRLADNAAILALPEPALVAVDQYEGLRGALVVLAGDHLHGAGLRQVDLDAPLCSTDRPVNLDWDFSSGSLEIFVPTGTRLRLALAGSSALRVDGETPELATDGAFRISAGRHTLSGARPDPEILKTVATRLAALLEEARQERTRSTVEAPHLRADLPSLSSLFTADAQAAVEALAVCPVDGEARLCAAAGAEVRVLSETGKGIHTLRADARIRVLRWWPEYRLLLAGCVDEQVIAFDLDSGQRRWTFTSQMDPAVWRAAKTYWFKSAPGHEGIHGLHTGAFLDGKTQAFAGSACTLEILDGDGRLVERLPVFWGSGTVFALIDGPEDSVDLLIAREPTDSHALAVVNSRALDARPRSFHGVPAGHTHIGGWACMSRRHIFYEDLDGDGEKELVSEINGTWNRVTVWRRDGNPLYAAHFGPGESIPAQNIADLDLADPEGKSEKKIVAALSSGCVVALDHQCRRLWTRRLPSPPAVLKCLRGETWVGCADGAVVVLDGRGEMIRKGAVRGRPTCVEEVRGSVLLATAAGEVALLGP